MKFLSFEAAGKASWGALEGDRISDLGARGLAPTLREFVASGESVSAIGEADFRLAEVELAPPISGARLLCVGMNYLKHIAEAGRNVPTVPSIFIRTDESVVAHGMALARPKASDNFDFEGEFAFIVGRPGRHIAQANALDHVFGYSIFNDGSVRDFQDASVTAGKNFDRSGAFGPWIVDREEAPAWDAMRLVTRLNGAVVQDDQTKEMLFSVPNLIEYLSKITTLKPGDVVSTGTPSGVGFRRSPPLWMKAGDVIEVEVSGIGTLSNPVVDE